MFSDVLDDAAELARAGQPFVLATVVARKKPQSARPGSSAIILADGTMRGWVGGGCVRPAVLREARAALADGQPRLVRLDPASSEGEDWEGVRNYPMTCQGEGAVEVYLEPVLPRPALLVLGRTPAAQALVRFGKALGFRVTAAEPTATAALFPDADAVLTDWADAARRAGEGDFIVVATMGEDDEGALEAAAASDARYIGLVASRRKGESLLAYLRSRGVAEARAARIKHPAGLDLGGVGAEEVALSIMAEIVQLRRARAVPTPVTAGGGGGGPATAPFHPGGGGGTDRTAGGGGGGGEGGGGETAGAKAGGEIPGADTRTRTPTRARARPSSAESQSAGMGEMHAQAGPASPARSGRPSLPLAPAGVAGPGRGGAPALARGGAEGPGEAVDPVCGMIVEVATSRHSASHGGHTYHFCCPRCKAAFERDPERYLPAAAG